MPAQKRDTAGMRIMKDSNDSQRCMPTRRARHQPMTSIQPAADPQAPPGLTPHFSPVRVAGSLAYVSGQMGFGTGFTLVQGGVAEQTRQCMLNIEAALAPVGLSLDNVVKTTVWLTRSDDFAAFNAAYADALGARTPPSRSTVRADLMVPGALVEIEAVALLP